MIDVASRSQNGMLHCFPSGQILSLLFLKNNKNPYIFQLYSRLKYEMERCSCEKPSYIGQEHCIPFYDCSILSLPYPDYFFIDFIIISKGVLKQLI
jgi:hypothetical protein